MRKLKRQKNLNYQFYKKHSTENCKGEAMRKSILDKIKNAPVNYAQEMQRVEEIFSNAELIQYYGKNDFMQLYPKTTTIETFFNEVLFINYPYCGNFISIYEMRDALSISSKDIKKNDLNTMLDYFEFVFNIVLFFINSKGNYEISFNSQYAVKLTDNIKSVLDKLNYEFDLKENYAFIVEKDSHATAVSEIYPDISEKVIEYRRFNLKGNLERKREILNTLWLKFEAIRPNLKANNFGEIETKTGSLLNNLNIRHNGVEGKNAKGIVQQMSNEELEQWYDKTYDMLLTSLMLNHYLSYKNDIEILNQALTKK